MSLTALFIKSIERTVFFPETEGDTSVPPVEEGRERPDENGVRGSFTIEASVIMPIVLSVILFVMILTEIMILEWGVSYSLDRSARDIALYGTFTDQYVENSASMGPAALLFLEQIKQNNVPYKFVEGHIVGFDLGESKIEKNWVDLKVNYRVNVPFPILDHFRYKLTQEAKSRRFTGYDLEEDDYEYLYVYVTPTGSAYHLSKECAYLNPSIRPVSKGSLSSQRNESGGKYRACNKCGAFAKGYVYVTDYGDVFHSTLSCSGLKRTIMRVQLKDAPQYHKCPKCGGG